jgi:hypothetical protein
MQKIALKLQLVHLSFSAIWNMLSVSLVALGMQALGPTSSFIGAIILMILALVLWFTAKRVKILYIVLSCFQLAAASATIFGAFTKEATLWPSEFWRLCGMVINALGVMGSLGILILLLISRVTLDSNIHNE